jgi:hypothetical protein
MAMTGKSILGKSIECVGSAADVRDCRGDRMLGNQGDKNGVCYFFPYRLGRGRPSVKVIRKFCLECQGGSRAFVADCENPACAVYDYRFGKNPAYVGRVPQGVARGDFSERETILKFDLYLPNGSGLKEVKNG